MVLSTTAVTFAAGSPGVTPIPAPEGPGTTLNENNIVVNASGFASMEKLSEKYVENKTALLLGGRSGLVTLADGSVAKLQTISKGAGENAENIEKLGLGKYVTKIQAEALSGFTSLRILKIRTTKKVTVNKNAFKGLDADQLSELKVQVNKKMSAARFKALKQALVKCGLKATNIKKNLKV
jgi:hypothetical protein